MAIASSISRVLDRGVEYLCSHQLETGGFLSLASADAVDFSCAIKYETVFSNALILQNLAQLTASHKTTEIKQRLVQFLLSQKSSQWSWNYWDRQSQAAQLHSYPDDLDDTYCALAALQLAQPELVAGEVLAQCVRQLTALEVTEGGPYTTWLVAPNVTSNWRDTDLGVNLNIGYFLQLNGVTLPNLTAYFEAAITNGIVTTPYYPRPLPILFFASRVLQNGAHKRLLLKALNQATPHNCLEDSLSLLSWINLGETGSRLFDLANKLAKAQQKDGSWPAATFYTGVNPVGTKKYFAGSAPLTTSYALLALASLATQEKSQSQKIPSAPETLKQKIIQKVKKRFSRLSPELTTIAEQYLDQVRLNDQQGQITLLPWLFCQAVGRQAETISEAVLLELGAASVYGWIAYTIYDDFLDAEAKPATLPLANCCLRELTKIFTEQAPKEAGFTDTFHQILDLQEAANVWEVTHCRFNPHAEEHKLVPPDFADLTTLANRSLGHCLGCCVIASQLGYTKNSSVCKNIQQFFQHYLIARQLNDDAHDWETDLARGRLTAIGTQLFLESPEERRKIFWTKTIDWACDTIQAHLAAAETALNHLPELEHPEILQHLLAGPAHAVKKVRQEQRKIQEFLLHYKKIDLTEAPLSPPIC